jgi:hypothetical protein
MYATVSVADPGSGSFLTPGSEMEKNPDPDPGLRTRIIFLKAEKQFFWVKI